MVLAGQKQRIVLEFMRDEEAIKHEYKFRAEQNRKRLIALSSCRLMDIKLEKAGAYELTPKVSSNRIFNLIQAPDTYFEADQPRGSLSGGQEIVIKFTFKPPNIDPLLKDIGALKGIGQWIESVWDLKLQGGFIEPGMIDPLIVEVVLRAYVQ